MRQGWKGARLIRESRPLEASTAGRPRGERTFTWWPRPAKACTSLKLPMVQPPDRGKSGSWVQKSTRNGNRAARLLGTDCPVEVEAWVRALALATGQVNGLFPGHAEKALQAAQFVNHAEISGQLWRIEKYFP